MLLVALAWVVADGRESARIATARDLALQGVRLRDVDDLAARLVGAAAVELHADAGTRAALTGTLLAGRQGNLPGASDVRDLALSADGRIALSADAHERVVRWELAPQGPPGRGLLVTASSTLQDRLDASAVALTADGRTGLIGGRDGSVRVWEMGGHSRSRTVVAGDGVRPVSAVALSRDGGRAVAGFDGGGVVFWDAAGGQLRRPSEVHASAVLSAGLSADGRRALTVSEDKAVVWDLADPARPVQAGVLTRPGVPWGAGALSADGRTAVTGNQVWDVGDPARPRRLATLPGVRSLMIGVAFTSDGSGAVTGEDGGRVGWWGLRDRLRPVLLAELPGSPGPVGAVALSADGGVAMSAAAGWGVMSWQVGGISDDPLRDVCADSALRALRVTPETWAKIAGGVGWPDGLGDPGPHNPCPAL
ncbi:WD40 repeat domain-containing protein [Nonomuraea sp. NPDC001699]